MTAEMGKVQASPAGAVEAEPVFILSCHRSGSTLLRYVLDTHPAVYAPPELFLGEAALHLAIFLAGLEGKEFEEQHLEGDGVDAVLAEVQRILRGRMDAAAMRRDKRIWCEKTPDNLLHLPLFLVLFPRARFLCLYRHGLDVAHSAAKMSQVIPRLEPFLLASRGHLVTATIRYWIDWTSRLLAFERAQAGQCFRLTYEDLVTRPQQVLPPLFAFLDLPWDAALLDAVFSTPHDHGIEDHYARSSRRLESGSIGSGRDLSLAGLPAGLLADLRRLLADLGYRPEPPSPPASTSAPGPAADAALPHAGRFFAEELPARLRARPELARVLPVRLSFSVAGEGGGSWVVEPPGAGASGACKVSLASADLIDIACGRINSLKAFEEGRVRIEGQCTVEQLQALSELLAFPTAAPFG